MDLDCNAFSPPDDGGAGSPSSLRASFVSQKGTTAIARLFERGSLRLRQPRGGACEGIVVNTGGGILGGDRLDIAVDVARRAAVTLTTVAAEKIYRSAGPPSLVETTLHLDAGASLAFVPQETILFDGARLRRRLAVEMAADARLVAAEIVVFGRLAMGETAISGAFRDRWRVRRGGRLIFADDTALEGAIGAALDRPAVAGGARACALVLLVAPDSEARLEPARAALKSFAQANGAGVEAGASSRDGLLVVRLLARRPELLRDGVAAVLRTFRDGPLPRVWT